MSLETRAIRIYVPGTYAQNVRTLVEQLSPPSKPLGTADTDRDSAATETEQPVAH